MSAAERPQLTAKLFLYMHPQHSYKQLWQTNLTDAGFVYTCSVSHNKPNYLRHSDPTNSQLSQLYYISPPANKISMPRYIDRQIDLPLTHFKHLQSVENATQGSFSIWDVATTSPTRSSVFVGSACRSELHSRWRRWRIVHCMFPHHLTWRRHSHVSPTCRTDAGSGPPPLNSLAFRPVVGQPPEVVPFLLLK